MSYDLAVPYRDVDEVLSGLAALQDDLLARRDRRGVFVSAYLLISTELARRLSVRAFQDDAWVAEYLVAFANLYRVALAGYETGGSVPRSWRIAFDAAATGAELVIQDLFLGINAHINHDLPLALTAVSIDPDRERRYADHTAVNEALEATTDGVQARIATLYDRGLGLLDDAFGSLDEAVTAFSFVAARENAWDRAVAIANATTGPERARQVQRLEEHSAVLARLIVAPTVPVWVLSALRHLETTRDWRECFR